VGASGCDGPGPCAGSGEQSSTDKNKDALTRMMRMSFKQDNLSLGSK